MKRVKSIFEKNTNFKCVIVTHNKEEFETLRDILGELRYSHSIIPDSLPILMDSRVKETNSYEHCWRVSDYMGVCWSADENLEEELAHWKRFCSDIIEIKNGELAWVE